MNRPRGAVVAAVAMVLVASACGSSGTKSANTNTNSNTTTDSGSTTGGQIFNPGRAGTPQVGGTLTVLGSGDVDDNLDPNYGYYTLDYLSYALYERNLYRYPSVQGQTFDLVPDLATAMPEVSDGGKEFTFTIRTGAMWNTTPARQVSAEDVVRGVKRSCNPTFAFAGQPDYNDVLIGYSDFCNGFVKVSQTSAAAQKAYVDTHNIAGVFADPSNPLEVHFMLSKPASYFPGTLNLSWANPVPEEIFNYVPGSLSLAAHMSEFSDGPYIPQSYVPNRSITFVRNPAWNQASDPVRHAYVNQIDVSETGNPQEIYQEILTNTPQADMQWDVHVPSNDVPGLIASKNPNFQLVTEGSTNPYIVFNTISHNNNDALSKVQVRQAIAYALDRSQFVQNAGGPAVSPPLTHLLAPGTNGSTPNFDDYPYNPTKAKQLLAQAGYTHLTLTWLYRPTQSVTAAKDFATAQSLLANVGITLKGRAVAGGDFYGKYLTPGTAAKNSEWDLAEAGWGPDWYPDGGKSYFLPILTCNQFPPTTSNFGFFCDPKLDSIVQQALAAPSDAAAAPLWHQADEEAMSQVAVYPVEAPNIATLHNSLVHNCVFIGAWQGCDLANVWLG
ncbi:MAG TPA: ABC transporter substrate-binding protein [Acidimicrobiales bacterium]|jgi:peptide/nickel transport system substrate-binding protein|nr:ABC transporter substrate-binding protein [Acidimicrobiales bacterium]